MKHPSDSIEDRRQKPWAMVETELLRDPSITPQHKALYGLLITYGPQSIFPGQQTLADCLGTSRSTIIRWLGEMQTSGLIDWEHRTGTSNRYYILGYANYKGGVARVEQGCSTGDTGGVARVEHDLDPLILNQELEEEPPLADSPPADDSPDNPNLDIAFLEKAASKTMSPQMEQILTDPSGDDPIEWSIPKPPPDNPADKIKDKMRAKFGDDPFSVGAHCQEARAAVAHPDMTVATKDINEWKDRPVREWCAFIRLRYEQATGRKGLWASDLREIATSDGMNKTPEQVSDAIRTMTKSPSCEWLRTAHRPTHSGFAGTLLNVLCGQVLPEGSAGPSTGRNGTGTRIAASTVTFGGQDATATV